MRYFPHKDGWFNSVDRKRGTSDHVSAMRENHYDIWIIQAFAPLWSSQFSNSGNSKADDANMKVYNEWDI